MRPLRLLHVSPFYEPAWGYGGMARASAGLCRALAARGHEVAVVTARLDASPRDEVLGGVRVRRFPGPPPLGRLLVPWAPGLGAALAKDAGRWDAAHLHGFRSGIAVQAARALRAAGVPYLLQTHGTLPHHGQRVLAKRVFDRLAGTRVVARAAALVAVSEAEVRDLPRAARVIPGGVTAPGRAARTAPRAGRRVLLVGSDRPQKRAEWLADVLQAVAAAEVELVGRFGRRFLRGLGRYARRVRARGVLAGDALAAAYANADVVAHPARDEAFGLVPFEAALLGTPAVVAGGHGCGEWFGRAGGCVVARDDRAGFVAAVARRLGDPALGAREAAAVADFARRELTWERVAAELEALYRELARARIAA